MDDRDRAIAALNVLSTHVVPSIRRQVFRVGMPAASAPEPSPTTVSLAPQRVSGRRVSHPDRNGEDDMVPLTRRLAAECLGTFWLVFGGCGSAVLAAGVADVGI